MSISPDRWRPTRAGLINVWQYADEVLEFERGKMVLFGPNGSGKTMALELLLPHLLDAKAQPARLSTSGSDRGGLWDRVTGYDPDEGRTGYLWLEFRKPSGATTTLGVRLRAKPSGGGDKHWFTTPQRVGHDLALLERGRPLSVEQLRAALEPEGTLWGSNTTGYREAVRTTLFPGWAEDRVAALLDTLLVIRKQNVSDGLSASRNSKRTNLSDLLTRALPPLDDLELGRVADGFADLDRRRDRIITLEADVETTRNLKLANRRYARAITARVVARVVQATTAFDNVARDLRQHEATLASKASEIEDLHERQAQLDTEAEALRGESEGITQSEAFRDGAQIDRLRQQAEDAEAAADDADKEASRSRDGAEHARARLAAARQREAAARQRLDHTRRALQAKVEELGGPLQNDTAEGAVEGSVHSWIEQRDSAIGHMRAEQDRLRTARALLAKAEEGLRKSEAQLSGAEEESRLCMRALGLAIQRWRAEVRTWGEAARELKPPPRELQAMDEPGQWQAALVEMFTAAREPLLEGRATLLAAAAEVNTREKTLVYELEALKSQPEILPTPPPGRRDRDGRPGAPLWSVLDFTEATPPPIRGAIESALADCGMLDAWLTPDGELDLGDDEVDVLLHASPLVAPSTSARTSAGIGALLDPDPTQDRVEAALVERLLGGIELTEANAHLEPAPPLGLVLGRDGTWRTTHRSGRADVIHARFIGASARAAERTARIEALQAKLGAVQTEVDRVRLDLRELELRLERCEEERRRFPLPIAVDDKQTAASAAERDVTHYAEALQDARRHQLDEAEASQNAERAVLDAASEHQLPADSDRLRSYELLLRSTERQLVKFKERVMASATAHDATKTQEEYAQHLDAAAARTRAIAVPRRLEATRARSSYQATLAAHGATYDTLLKRKAEIDHREHGLRREQKELRRRRLALEGERGSVGAKLENTRRRRLEAEQERELTQIKFRQLCRDALVHDAEIGPSPHSEILITATATLAAARDVRAAEHLGPQVDPRRELTLHNGVMGKLAAATRQLAGRAEVLFEPTEQGWSVLRVLQGGIATPIRELSETLAHDLQLAKDELSRKEQALFEEILAGSIREHLKDRLYSAQELVTRINELLKRVESAAGGVRVQLKWEIDPNLGEAGELRRAKELLLHDSPIRPDRSELDAFLRQRIERVRADDSDTGDWQERLAAMLDYRDWHRFEVLVHHKRFGDRPRLLQSRKVSLSAGEKTIVMVLPLIVAIAAHYEPARGAPPCVSPRLLLMDELFPKLDFPNKRQLMGLLTTLDLDCVFTSDKDRCEYDTIDGIAIIVFRKHADDKTTTTRLVWNGSDLAVDEPKESPA